MTYMVPFDGSALSEAALTKARVHAIALEESRSDITQELHNGGPLEVVAVSVVPDSPHYAGEKGWLEEGEEFSTRRVVERLHEQVTGIDPSAAFQFERIDGAARAGGISQCLRRKADELGASVVFIGSENAGRIVTPVTSVSAAVAADQDYDVFIVRRPLPQDVRSRLKSDFFVPG